jgi:hypothetical protein
VPAGARSSEQSSVSTASAASGHCTTPVASVLLENFC